MEVRLYRNEDLNELVKLYKSMFAKHNVFLRSNEEVTDYVKGLHNSEAGNNGGLFLALESGKIIGAVFLCNLVQHSNSGHTVWKLRHFAVAKEYDNNVVGENLLRVLEDHIKTLISSLTIKTAKIEITIAENEVPSYKFYKKFGFRKEGKLRNHYRWDETTYILGKWFGGE